MKKRKPVMHPAPNPDAAECRDCGRTRPAAEFFVPSGILLPTCSDCRIREAARRDRLAWISVTRIAALRRYRVDRFRRRSVTRALARKEVTGMPERNEFDRYAGKVVALPFKVAEILSRTHVRLGDDSKLPSDRAIEQIADLLYDLDKSIFERLGKKR